MSNNEILKIEPMYLQFPFELKKQMSCSLNLTNKTDNNVAFKVKTKNPKNNCVRPNYGLILPKSTCKVLVTMQAQKEAPSDMQSNEKFKIQSVIASPGLTAKEVTRETFSKESGHLVEETKLRIHHDQHHQFTKDQKRVYISVFLLDIFSLLLWRWSPRARNSDW